MPGSLPGAAALGYSRPMYRSAISRRRLLALLNAGVATGAAAACSATNTSKAASAAVRTQYRTGVPHTSATGIPLMRYAPGRSFFPIGLYHGLHGQFGDRRYDFSLLRESGFNLVFPWRGQPLATVVEAARANRLQIVWHEPTDIDQIGRAHV